MPMLTPSGDAPAICMIPVVLPTMVRSAMERRQRASRFVEQRPRALLADALAAARRALHRHGRLRVAVLVQVADDVRIALELGALHAVAPGARSLGGHALPPLARVCGSGNRLRHHGGYRSRGCIGAE